MAYQTEIYCVKCEQNKTIICGAGNMPGNVCHQCKEIEETARRMTYFSTLDDLPLKDRIRKIEEWIYDYKPTYVAPPRF